jgi:hypothetical protein
MSGQPAQVPLQLRLYVSRHTPESAAVETNLRRVCDEVGLAYEVEVFDVREHPDEAERDRIVLTPTLLRLTPPEMRVAGDPQRHPVGDGRARPAGLGADPRRHPGRRRRACSTWPTARRRPRGRSPGRAERGSGPPRTLRALVGEALDDVPDELWAQFDNVAVLVEDRDEDEPELLGIYEGIPLTERDEYGGALPDVIRIFRLPLCRDVRGRGRADRRGVRHRRPRVRPPPRHRRRPPPRARLGVASRRSRPAQVTAAPSPGASPLGGASVAGCPTTTRSPTTVPTSPSTGS